MDEWTNFLFVIFGRLGNKKCDDVGSTVSPNVLYRVDPNTNACVCPRT